MSGRTVETEWLFFKNPSALELVGGDHVIIDGIEVVVVAVTPDRNAAKSITTRPVTDAD